MQRTALRRWAPMVFTLAVLALLVAGPAAADPGHNTIPKSSSPVQDEIESLYNLVGWMSIVTSVIVLGLLGYVIVRYYDGSGSEARGEWFTHNFKLEVTWTVVTLLVLVFLGVVTYQTMAQIGDFDTRALEEDSDLTEIVALGQQWQWQFIYPDGNKTADTLYIEANKTFRMYSVSCDVLHSVYMPNLGVKIDTTVLDEEECSALKEKGEIPTDPGLNKFRLEASAGTYEVNCAEFCGRAHAAMRGEVVAFEPDEREKSYGPPPPTGKVRHVEITGSADAPTLNPDEIELNTGDLTTWHVYNNGSSTVNVEVPGYDVDTGSLAPGESAEVRFTVADEGEFDVTVSGTPAGTLTVSSGEVVHVEMSDNPWYIRDGNQFEPGKSYAIKVWNNGTIDHNLYIGTFASDRDAREPLFKTETYGAGEFRWLNVTMPDEDATLDWWCDVPGHADAGMLDEIVVGAGGGTGTQGESQRALLPSPGVLAAMLGLSAAAWLGRRRRD